MEKRLDELTDDELIQLSHSVTGAIAYWVAQLAEARVLTSVLTKELALRRARAQAIPDNVAQALSRIGRVDA